jgi:hypothetical protein
VSPAYGRKQAAAVAVLSATGADADLVTVLLPAGGGLDADVTVTADCAGDEVEVRLERAGTGVDTVRWTTAGDVGWERAC